MVSLISICLTQQALSSVLTIDTSQDLPLGVEKSLRALPYLEDENGLRQAYTGEIVWSIISGEDTILLEDNGLITALREGEAVVQATAPALGLMSKATIAVADEPIHIYFHAPNNWDQANIWYWYLDGSAHASGQERDGTPLKAVQPASLGPWPGPAMTPVENRPGWFYFAVPSIRSSELAPFQLEKQPVRVLFYNASLDERSREMLHYDGCFLSYNKYLGDPSEGLIDGRWDSPNNCRTLPKKRRLIAKPAGGPIWTETWVDIDITFGEIAEIRYSIDDSQTDAREGQLLAPEQTSIHLSPEVLATRDELTLCVFIKDEQDNEFQECYDYFAKDEVKFSGLGAVYSKEETTFAIWSPDRRHVQLWLDGRTLPMGYIGDAIDTPGVYALTVPGNHLLKRYHFQLDGQVVRDPYGQMVVPATDYNVVIDIASIEPEGGWAPVPELLAREDSVVYEMSIRDFTIDPSSGVSPELRGKFLGAVERGAYLNKGLETADPSIKTGLDHLIEMGVTHVQLLPIYDFATCSVKDPDNIPGCYNWGFDPENWNVPEEMYALDPYDYEGRVRELQTMINEFHKAGIRVIMDVVYNHTWVRPWREADEGEKFLGDITGQYFLHDDEGIGYQLTGTGNTIDARETMPDRLIRESLAHWVRHYNIDGFRFDMVGVFEYKTVEGWINYLERLFPDKKLVTYGEPWTALEDPNPDNFRLRHMSRIKDESGAPLKFGGFNFVYREAIKGFNDWGGGGGFAFNQIGDLRPILNGLQGSIGNQSLDLSSFAADPAQTINYVTSHDNLTMFDKILAWTELQEEFISFDYQKRIASFAHSIPLLSQGITMLHSGGEMLRSKDGIYDSYRSPDSINRIDWQRKKDYFDVYDYIAATIEARREFPGFSLESAEDIRRYVRASALGPSLVELRIRPNPRSDADVLVFLNAGADTTVNLPSGEWRVRLEHARRGQDRPVQGQVSIGGTTSTVLYRY